MTIWNFWEVGLVLRSEMGFLYQGLVGSNNKFRAMMIIWIGFTLFTTIVFIFYVLKWLTLCHVEGSLVRCDGQDFMELGDQKENLNYYSLF